MNTVDSRQAATRFSRTALSPPATASLVCMSMHQPQPLIWLARSDTSSWTVRGSDDWWIIRPAPAKRFMNVAETGFSNRLNRVCMVAPSLLGWASDEHEMPGTAPA